MVGYLHTLLHPNYLHTQHFAAEHSLTVDVRKKHEDE